MIESKLHLDPNFAIEKTKFFQNFTLTHLPEMRKYYENGLLVLPGANQYKNIARHQLLSGVMADTICELMDLDNPLRSNITHYALIHDVQKRRVIERKNKLVMVSLEFKKNYKPLVATSSNFRDFEQWTDAEYILRYVDSSVGEDSKHAQFGQWSEKRDPGNLPKVLIVPWRERVESFRKYRKEQGELGKTIYGISTWDKLEQIMLIIENNLFVRIINKNTRLAKFYSNSSSLTELIEEQIHKRILRK